MTQIREKDPETYPIIGASMAVHAELGCGFLEPAYQDAFEWECKQRDIPFVREKSIPILYKAEVLGTLPPGGFLLVREHYRGTQGDKSSN